MSSLKDYYEAGKSMHKMLKDKIIMNYDKEIDEILNMVAWYGSYKRSGDEPEGPTLSPSEAKQRINSLLARARLSGRLLGVSNSNDAFHDLSSPNLIGWFEQEMKYIESEVAEFQSQLKYKND